MLLLHELPAIEAARTASPAPVTVEVRRPCELNAAQWAAWSEIRRRDPDLDSPFFHHEFVRAVAEVRDDVEVAILRQGETPCGFLPFHRNRRNIGRPVGMKLCDAQGAVVSPGTPWSVENVLRASRLRLWHFDNLIATQTAFQPYQAVWAESHFIDLSEGFEAYEAQRRQTGCTWISQTARKARKLSRQLGPVRVELHTEQRDVFETLLRWKSRQRQRTGSFDVLRLTWVVQLLDRLRTTDTPEFSGMLSALFAGRTLLAAHLGLRSGRVLHYWFTAYDETAAKFSPGLMLMFEVARRAPELGIRRIDLGKGPEPWKAELQSGARPVAEGTAGLSPIGCALRTAFYRARHRLRTSPLRRTIQRPKSLLRRMYYRFVMR